MPNVFARRSDLIFRTLFAAAVFGVPGLAGAAYFYVRSPYRTGVGVEIEQPVPFSHQHHVGQLGIDCRYCHAHAEHSRSAGMPALEVCMNCHARLWTAAEPLEPLREAWRRSDPIRWNRVHDLADFSYFDHSAHLRAGVGCSTCHGQVDQMPLVRKANTLQMSWCVDCHRAPDRFIRPAEQLYDMTWTAESAAQNAEMVAQTSARDALTECSACHR